MKKSIFIFCSALFLAIIITFVVNISVPKENEFSILLKNVEALASSSEGGSSSGRVKHPVHTGKEYCKYSVVYELSGVASGCITWHDFKPLGDVKADCYTSR